MTICAKTHLREALRRANLPLRGAPAGKALSTNSFFAPPGYYETNKRGLRVLVSSWQSNLRNQLLHSEYLHIRKMHIKVPIPIQHIRWKIQGLGNQRADTIPAVEANR